MESLGVVWDSVLSHHGVEPIKLDRRASCSSLVVIQETTESRTPPDGTLPSIGQRHVDQRIGQALMIAFAMIMRDVLGHGVPKVPFAKWNDGSRHSCLMDRRSAQRRIRIRRPRRRLHHTDASLTQQLSDRRAPLRVPIANQYAMRAQQPVIRRRHRATDLPHKHLVGIRRRSENVHAS